MQTHNVKSKTKRAPSRRVGRGGKRGKTAGRGTKGQNARAGRKKRPEMRDVIKKFPKRRGRGKQGLYSYQAERAPISLADIAGAFKAGDTVSTKTLVERGMISVRGNRYPLVKVLSGGELTFAVTVEGCTVSASAKAAIEKAGGSVRETAKAVVVKKPRVRKEKAAAEEKAPAKAKAAKTAKTAAKAAPEKSEGSDSANA